MTTNETWRNAEQESYCHYSGRVQRDVEVGEEFNQECDGTLVQRVDVSKIADFKS